MILSLATSINLLFVISISAANAAVKLEDTLEDVGEAVDGLTGSLGPTLSGLLDRKKRNAAEPEVPEAKTRLLGLF